MERGMDKHTPSRKKLIYTPIPQLVGRKKPTGSAVVPPEVSQAKEIEGLIQAKAEMRAIDDGDASPTENDSGSDADSSDFGEGDADSDSDVSDPGHTQKKSKANSGDARMPSSDVKNKLKKAIISERGPPKSGILLQSLVESITGRDSAAATAQRDEQRGFQAFAGSTRSSLHSQLRDKEQEISQLRDRLSIAEKATNDAERRADRWETEMKMYKYLLERQSSMGGGNSDEMQLQGRPSGSSPVANFTLTGTLSPSERIT
ncbi:hypothetical protein FRB94_005237 [Tulasnella sp. JGI-2019a]|nr:hypothetical protein FRB94_005237 [Tulasnella sp. JGI-2019a]